MCETEERVLVVGFASSNVEVEQAKPQGFAFRKEAQTNAVGGIDATLKERGNRYGKFICHAHTTQGLKDVMRDSPKWYHLKYDQREALEMIAHKIGRILNGDPDYHDSWHDIVGYAKLVADRLEGVER